ncbi:MAG TPA: aldose epimerase family protein, partial [Gaiellaceae bacterium]
DSRHPHLVRMRRGRAVLDRFVLADTGITVALASYGARIVSLKVADAAGRDANVALGFGDVSSYAKPGDAYLGATVGRYANRIAGGRFGLDGREVQLTRNEGDNHLHGGERGLDKHVWEAMPMSSGVTFRYRSEDGDQGYPGALDVEVRYTVGPHALRIDYAAVTSAPTVVSLTNHALFNLAGEGSGDVLSHELEIAAGRYTPADAELIPTGEIAAVDGTPFDFRAQEAIGARIHDSCEQLRIAGGYDHNFVLDGDPSAREPRFAARLAEPSTGRVLEVFTTEPGLQVYTGNRLDGSLVGAGGRRYERYAGVALETQRFPDSPNHPHFPSALVTPERPFRSTTELRFF